MPNQEQDNSNNTSKSDHPPGSQLALAIAIWVWGMMASYFPTYASVPAEWAWPFQGLSYICYCLGAITALFGLSTITNSKFLQYVITGLAFSIVAYLLHLWATTMSSFIVALSLHLLVFLLAGFGLVYFLLSIPYLWAKPKAQQISMAATAGQGGTLDKVSLPSPEKSKFEQIAGIIIATLALLTALIPLIKSWFNVQ